MNPRSIALGRLWTELGPWNEEEESRRPMSDTTRFAKFVDDWLTDLFVHLFK